MQKRIFCFVYPQGKYKSARFRLSIESPCMFSIKDRQVFKIISIINVPAVFIYVFTYYTFSFCTVKMPI